MNKTALQNFRICSSEVVVGSNEQDNYVEPTNKQTNKQTSSGQKELNVNCVPVNTTKIKFVYVVRQK